MKYVEAKHKHYIYPTGYKPKNKMSTKEVSEIPSGQKRPTLLQLFHKHNISDWNDQADFEDEWRISIVREQDLRRYLLNRAGLYSPEEGEVFIY